MVSEIILSLDGCKATPVGDIPADMLKSTADIHLFITKIIFLLEMVVSQMSENLLRLALFSIRTTTWIKKTIGLSVFYLVSCVKGL